MNLARHEKEKYFLTASGEKQVFPSLHDPPSIELSVVVPAYNEELRSEFAALLRPRPDLNLDFDLDLELDDYSNTQTSPIV